MSADNYVSIQPCEDGRWFVSPYGCASSDDPPAQNARNGEWFATFEEAHQSACKELGAGYYEYGIWVASRLERCTCDCGQVHRAPPKWARDMLAAVDRPWEPL